MDELNQQIHDKAKEIMATVKINDSEDVLAALRIAVMSGIQIQIADQMKQIGAVA